MTNIRYVEHCDIFSNLGKDLVWHYIKLINNTLLSDPCPSIVLPWYSNRSSSILTKFSQLVEPLLLLLTGLLSLEIPTLQCMVWIWTSVSSAAIHKSRSFCKYWLCVMTKLYYDRRVMITVGKTSGSCGVHAVFQACFAHLFSVRTHTCFCKSVFCAAIHK